MHIRDLLKRGDGGGEGDGGCLYEFLLIILWYDLIESMVFETLILLCVALNPNIVVRDIAVES